jgi:HSP20 family molecular chaperone IbpA
MRVRTDAEIGSARRRYIMPPLEKWTPMRDLELMDRRMRRFFGELGITPPLTPAADVYEAKGELVVELEVPGFDESELKIEVSDHLLTISGARSEKTERDETAVRLHERLERSFERRFELPAELDSKHIHADYSKGVVTIHVPKGVETTPRTIEITKA